MYMPKYEKSDTYTSTFRLNGGDKVIFYSKADNKLINDVGPYTKTAEVVILAGATQMMVAGSSLLTFAFLF